jgi:3-deoxy-manno-octulosonate cytidylyltransferase (CMP-KDO synthetase)
VVATDDERIANVVLAFGGNVCYTSPSHQSGTDRCAEVLAKEAISYDIVVNIQGDEPFIQPEQIELLLACFKGPGTEIATLVKEITTFEELINTNSPKVVLGDNQQALYFSRNPIPFCRGYEQTQWLQHHTYYKHIGMYAYRADVLAAITKLQPSPLEIAESLEQLRWLAHGYKIKVNFTTTETIAIDTPEDLKKLQ